MGDNRTHKFGVEGSRVGGALVLAENAIKQVVGASRTILQVALFLFNACLDKIAVLMGEYQRDAIPSAASSTLNRRPNINGQLVAEGGEDRMLLESEHGSEAGHGRRRRLNSRQLGTLELELAHTSLQLDVFHDECCDCVLFTEQPTQQVTIWRRGHVEVRAAKAALCVAFHKDRHTRHADSSRTARKRTRMSTVFVVVVAADHASSHPT